MGGWKVIHNRRVAGQGGRIVWIRTIPCLTVGRAATASSAAMNTLAGAIMPVISTAPLIAAPRRTAARPPMFIHAQQPPTSRFPLLLFPVYAIVYIVIFVIICARVVIFRYESPKRPVLQDRCFPFYVWLSCRAGFIKSPIHMRVFSDNVKLRRSCYSNEVDRDEGVSARGFSGMK